MSKDINDLLPKVKEKCQQLITACKAQGITIIVTATYRSIAEQDAIYAQGRTASGVIVTKARGGQSLHNWRVAFDIAPVVGGVIPWNDTALFARIGAIGQAFGLEWGGSWGTFQDPPHFQYTLGHDWPDFQAGKVDLKIFDLDQAPIPKATIIPDEAFTMAQQILSLLQKGDKKGARDQASYLFTKLS